LIAGGSGDQTELESYGGIAGLIKVIYSPGIIGLVHWLTAHVGNVGNTGNEGMRFSYNNEGIGLRWGSSTQLNYPTQVSKQVKLGDRATNPCHRLPHTHDTPTTFGSTWSALAAQQGGAV